MTSPSMWCLFFSQYRATPQAAVPFLFSNLCGLLLTLSICHDSIHAHSYSSSLSNFSSFGASDAGRLGSSKETNHEVPRIESQEINRNVRYLSSVDNTPTNLTSPDVKIVAKCDISSGSWVHDLSYPFYDARICPYLDGEVTCQQNGRPDSDYQKWRWKPRGCDLPRFNALYFLRKMRGKTIMFVGDSLNRGQWESMMCLLHSVLPQSRVSYVSGDPISTFKALDYAATVSFHRAPYLVDMVSTVVEGKNKIVLRLDSVEINSRWWRGVDVLVFNSGHWWTHTGNLRGWDYMQDGNHIDTDMDRSVAFRKGMSTWANWVDSNINTKTTRVFFRSYSPSHVSPKEWNNLRGANCYSEREPILGYSYPGPYPPLYNVAKGVVSGMRRPVYFLDVTLLSLLRKDGHPSIYSSDFSPGQRKNPARFSDCAHWCLPGIPDTWNEILYAALFFHF